MKKANLAKTRMAGWNIHTEQIILMANIGTIAIKPSYQCQKTVLVLDGFAWP
ncbi:MAG: hypothetical protein AB1489_03810 [Acidobacteriota bacterium]